MLPRASFKELLFWLLGRRRRFRVAGNSMAPLIKAGDTVLTKRTRVAVSGDFVVAAHPLESGMRLLKEVAAIQDGNYLLKSRCHSECSWKVERVEGIVTSVL